MSHCFIRFEEEMNAVVAIQKALGPKVYDDRMPSWLIEAAQEVVFGDSHSLEEGGDCPREHLREGLETHKSLLEAYRKECAEIKSYLDLDPFPSKEEVEREVGWRVMGYEDY